jgi:glycine/D-amino acid oxidase-like deaminating enzyme
MRHSRRHLLRMGGAAASLALLGRCASRVATSASSRDPPAGASPRASRRRAGTDHPPRRGAAAVSPGRLRRPREPLGDKLLVHDYGHGGAGVTLSWGTAELAADLVRDSGRGARSAAVIGCGAVGLAAARILQEARPRRDRLRARAAPRHDVDGRGRDVVPVVRLRPGHVTPAFLVQFERAQRLAHRRFQTLVGDDYAVRWREIYVLSTTPTTTACRTTADRPLPGAARARAGESPFAAPRAVVESTMFIEPPPYLRALMRDVRLAGGRIVVRDFASPGALLELPEPVVVNCAGLAPASSSPTATSSPSRAAHGALPQPEVDYAMESGRFYMFPRPTGSCSAAPSSAASRRWTWTPRRRRSSSPGSARSSPP